MSDCCAGSGGKDKAYDLAVIGAGSAGFAAAIAAAEQGAQVALIGYGTIGGTCVNFGCVPSKTLIRATEALHQAAAAARFAGVRAEARIDDWRAVVRHKGELVSELRQAKYADLLPTYNTITYLDGTARLADGGVVVNGTLIKSSKVIIATGARPAVPRIPDIESIDYIGRSPSAAMSTGSAAILATSPIAAAGSRGRRVSADPCHGGSRKELPSFALPRPAVGAEGVA